MMILSDEEIMEIRALKDGRPYGTFELCRAIEAATLAKLANAELPDPATVTVLKEIPYYTYDQLCEAYAQGAAAQLSAEPEWYVYRVNNSGWGCVPASYVPHEDVYDEGTLTPLYTLRQA